MNLTPPRTPSEARSNLPAQLTSFVGREREIAEVKRLLTTTRLLTLTGAGGCGKTRLALHVAADVVDDYPDGVRLVELAALAEEALVAQAVASTLGVRERPGVPAIEGLVAALHAKSLLIVLDNCEHLVHAAAELADALLRACPGLRILATSREALGSAGETTWRVPSLSMPSSSPGASAGQQWAEYEAMQLFVDRALAVRPDFQMGDQTTPAVVEICRRLDGIPLAIELAAARVRVLSVEQIAARLDDRFRLLTVGRRTAMPRQQTLRATVDWSHQLLSEPERMLLRRLAVFAGGWTVEAAESVTAGDGIQTHAVLDLLAQLVDKSLVLAEEEGGAIRYRLLETLRQYAHDRLVEAGEAEQLRDRHLAHFLVLAEAAEPVMRESEATAVMDRLEREHDNLRAALEWSLTRVPGRHHDRGGLEHRTDPRSSGGTGSGVPDRRGLGDRTGSPTQKEAALRLSGALSWFWWGRSHHSEGRRWLTRALAEAPAPSAARMKALNGAAWLAHHQRDGAAARALLDESLAIARRLADRWAIAWALHCLGRVAYFDDDPALTRHLAEESLSVAEETGDRWLIAWALHLRGIAAYIATDYPTARAYYEQSLAIRRELGYEEGIMILLGLLGITAFREADFTRAHALFREALALQRRLDWAWSFAMVLSYFSALASSQGETVRAVRLAAAAAMLSETYQTPIIPLIEAVLTEELTRSKQALDEAAYAAAWSEGRAMPLEESIAEALAIDVRPAAAAHEPAPASPGNSPFDLLTPAEVQVLRLLAAGRTTKEIAAALVVAISTVDRHLTHIYQKLGVRNRAEAVVVALQHQLV